MRPIILLVLLGAGGLDLLAQVPAKPTLDVPTAAVRPLSSVPMKLAKLGHGEDAARVIEALRELGWPEKKCAGLEKSCARAAKRGKPDARKLTKLAASIRKAAARLGKLIPNLDDDSTGEALARIILTLDRDNEEARAMLGWFLEDGEWIDPDSAKLKDRRREIVLALGRARRLEIPLEVDVSRHPLLLEATGSEGTKLSYRRLVVHSARPRERAVRVVREALRSLAFCNYLLDGKLELRGVKPSTWIFLDSRADYLRSAKAIEAAGNMGFLYRDGKAVDMDGFFDDRGRGIMLNQTESDAEASLLSYLFSPFDETQQACMTAGILNLVCAMYFGCPMPSYSYLSGGQLGTGPKGYARTVSEEDKAELERLLRFSRTGIKGCRAYLAYLARKEEDPAWLLAMQDQIGKIQGENLLKTTIVCEYLAEGGRLGRVLRETPAVLPINAKKRPEEIFSRVLGKKLPAFEDEWRRWLLEEAPCLSLRLEQRARSADRKSAPHPALAHLNALRTMAMEPLPFSVEDVTVEPSLSRGCLAHARYLGLHPEQAEAWPDAHEEYPDKEGFSTEGAWAGGQGVIAPGVGTATQAIDSWMGTFYHRLPLIDPGLAGIGWGLAKNVAVLDCSSLVEPIFDDWTVMWPPNGMTGVPLSFSPELPNPVPGEDQSNWGYPITLQLGRRATEMDPQDVDMKLFAGKGKDLTPVPCHLSTPANPTNVELAPAGAFCLIPKATLKAGTDYTVTARIPVTSETFTWTFRTR